MAETIAVVGVGPDACRWAAIALPDEAVVDAATDSLDTALAHIGDATRTVVVLPHPTESADQDYLQLLRRLDAGTDVFVVFLEEAYHQPTVVSRRLARFTDRPVAAHSPWPPPQPSAAVTSEPSVLEMVEALAARIGGIATRWHRDLIGSEAPSTPSRALDIDGLVADGWVQSGRLASLPRPRRAPRPGPRKAKLVVGNPRLRRRLKRASHTGAAAIAPVLSEVETFCQFLGYPRSGSTIVGALLDAHPDVVISHELDLNRYVEMGFDRDQLLWLILKRSMTFADLQRTRGKYHYDVAGQWQGRCRSLRVAGDKQAGITTNAFGRDPELADRVRSAIGHRMVYLHVVRNPYDNIATDFARISAKTDGATVAGSIERYAGLVEAVTELKTRFGDEIHDIRHEEFVAEPHRHLGELASILGVDADPDWIDAAAAVVNPTPSRTRDRAPWTSEDLDRVGRLIASTPHLEGYVFDGD